MEKVLFDTYDHNSISKVLFTTYPEKNVVHYQVLFALANSNLTITNGNNDICDIFSRYFISQTFEWAVY